MINGPGWRNQISLPKPFVCGACEWLKMELSEVARQTFVDLAEEEGPILAPKLFAFFFSAPKVK